MRYLCLERCFDSGACRGYYEEEFYDFTKQEIKNLKATGLIKHFKPVQEPEKEQPTPPDPERGPQTPKPTVQE
jgi:hypothetical protein